MLVERWNILSEERPFGDIENILSMITMNANSNLYLYCHDQALENF